MTRARFGTWGTDLSEERFGEALAALGVLLAAGKYDAGSDSAALAGGLAEELRQAGRQPVPWGPPDERWPDPQSLGRAEPLAQAWHEVVRGPAPEPPRLEIGLGEDPAFDEAWASRLLADVGARSVYVRDERLSEDADWGWPLRVGLLGADVSDWLREEIRSSVPWPDLYELGEGSGGLDEIDLLLSPHDPDASLEKVAAAREPVQANCVVVFRSPFDPWASTRPVLEALATRAEASGVVVVPVPLGGEGKWFARLVESLAHDQPLDVAVAQARQATDPPAVFLAHRRLVEVSRLMLQAERMTRRVMAADGGGAPVPVTRGMAKRTGLEEGIEAAAGVADRIRAEMEDPDVFIHESRGASTVAELARAAEPILSPSAERNLRRILARVHDISDPNQPREEPSAFRADAPQRVEVWIGPWELGAIAASERFPEEELPPSPRGHRLTVVFTEPKSAPEPQVQTLYLPRAGRSSSCEFAFRPRAGEGRVEARISVLYRNRVLQTALLRGEILPDPGRAPAGAAIRLDVEAVVRPSLGELRGRRPFDAALIFNRTGDGDPALTVVSGPRADFRHKAGMLEFARKIEQELTQAAESPERYDSFDSPASLVLLRTLANQGVVLRQTLFGEPPPPAYEALARAERIQVLAMRPEELIPLELLYDRPPPSSTAGLCPNFQQRVLEGRCGDDCPGGDQVPSPVVCPLAFWCANRIIERHATVETDLPEEDLRLDLRLLSEPTSERNVLPAFASGLLGASGRVDSLAGTSETLPVQKILDALQDATGQRADRVDTWEEWRARVRERHPTLLMVLPHTLESLGVESLEIGQGDVLMRSHLGPDILGIEGADAPPIVVLLGCDTAMPMLPFQSFVLAFRQNGAAIVLGTIAAILGRYAAPLAEELIRDLRAVAPAPSAEAAPDGGDGADVTFGDILHEVRRKLMAKGQLMALTLTAYGDADWRLGPAAPPDTEGGGGR